MKIVHVITGLGQGGAESSLARLISMSKNPASHVVISLMDEGVHGLNLRSIGVNIYALKSAGGRFSISNFNRLRKIIRDENPDVVQTWMYHADLLGGLASMINRIPVVWSVRHSNITLVDMGARTWLVAKACALLSSLVPFQIINCSQRSIQLHRQFGYADRFVHIPNGFDVSIKSKFEINHSSGSSPVFGHAARLHQIKGHSDFIKAVQLLKNSHPELRVLMAGSGVTLDNPKFSLMISEGIHKIINAIGPQTNMSEFYSKCDVFVLSSCGEAFPNVVAEAMLAGLPCIVTDVGDAAEIVGDTGWVVPAKNPEALANAMHQAIAAMAKTDTWADRKAAACARITNLYSMDKMQSRFEAAWTAAMEN